MELKLSGIRKSYDETLAVKEFSVTVPSGKLLALVGPSGCGKTTILRIIAGLIQPDTGEVILNGRKITKIKANKRPTVTVFQDYALFPHLNVFNNIAYGLKTGLFRTGQVRQRVWKVASLLQITELLGRRIHELSGGQQQRVAVARALVVDPQVILFDEPLSSLDAKLRVEMREEIRRIQQTTGITAVYVTHDQEEALAVADIIAVMNKGVVEQVGSPRQIYLNPVSSFVGQFIGGGNLVSGTLVSHNGVKARLSVWGREIDVEYSQEAIKKDGFRAGPVQLFFRPENITPREGAPWEAVVLDKAFYGPVTEYKLHIEGQDDAKPVIMNIYNSNESFAVGDRISLDISGFSVVNASGAEVKRERD